MRGSKEEMNLCIVLSYNCWVVIELVTHIYSIHLDKSNIFLELISINFASVLGGQTVAAKSLLSSENINRPLDKQA